MIVGLEVRSSNGDRLIRVVCEDGKGAGRVETNAANCARVDIVLIQGTPDGKTDASPYIGSRLFLGCRISTINTLDRISHFTHVMILLGLPETNVLRSQAYDIALGVNDTCSCTSSAHVDANVIIGMDMKLIVRFCS